jgi:hypothetical protein
MIDKTIVYYFGDADSLPKGGYIVTGMTKDIPHRPIVTINGQGVELMGSYCFIGHLDQAVKLLTNAKKELKRASKTRP